jgi:hypothetical protein
MDVIYEAIELANSYICAGIAIVFAWAVIDNRIKDGVLIKTGLILLSIGLFGVSMTLYEEHIYDKLQAIERSILLINIGCLVAIGGVALRFFVGKKPARRVTDWADLNSEA